MKTKFPRILWLLTQGDENLFECSKEHLYMLRLIAPHFFANP